jgi:hypothetical protein
VLTIKRSGQQTVELSGIRVPDGRIALQVPREELEDILIGMRVIETRGQGRMGMVEALARHTAPFASPPKEEPEQQPAQSLRMVKPHA